MCGEQEFGHLIESCRGGEGADEWLVVVIGKEDG